MNSAVTSVLFDFDHTLGNDSHLEVIVLGAMVQAHSSSVKRADFLPLLQASQRGDLTLAAMIESIFGADEALLTEYKSTCLKQVDRLVSPLPGAEAALESLKNQGFEIAILSNGWTELQHAKARKIQFPGPVLTSEEVSAWKPAPQAFLRAAEKLQFSPNTTLYIGDSPETDVTGAKSAGMRAGWLNTEDKLYPADAQPPDLIITSLAQLPEKIQKEFS